MASMNRYMLEHPLQIRRFERRESCMSHCGITVCDFLRWAVENKTRSEITFVRDIDGMFHA